MAGIFQKTCTSGDYSSAKDGPESEDHWYLVDMQGQKFQLPKTWLSLGREDCHLLMPSQLVNKRHAALSFDFSLNRFQLQDLSSSNGTFVNNCRIPEQAFVTLQHMDSIRLGQDTNMYHIEQASQIVSCQGQLPDPQFIPSWAIRAHELAQRVHSPSLLADCQLHYIGLYGWFPTLGCSRAWQNKVCPSDPSSVQTSSSTAAQPSEAVLFLSEDSLACRGFQCDTHLKHDRSNHANGSTLPGQHTFQMSGHSRTSDVATHQSPMQFSPPVTTMSSVPLHLFHSETTVPCCPNHLFQPKTTASSRHIQLSHANTSAAGTPKHLSEAKCETEHVSDLNSSNVDGPLTAGSYWKHCVAETDQTVFFVPLEHVTVPGASTSASPVARQELTQKPKPSPPTDVQNLMTNKVLADLDLTVGVSGILSANHIQQDERSGPSQGSSCLEIPIRGEACPHNQPDVSKVTGDALRGHGDYVAVPEQELVQNQGADNTSPALSFTVDFDDPEQSPRRPLNISSHLSQFVPTKILRRHKPTSMRTSLKESAASKLIDEPDCSPLSRKDRVPEDKPSFPEAPQAADLMSGYILTSLTNQPADDKSTAEDTSSKIGEVVTLLAGRNAQIKMPFKWNSSSISQSPTKENSSSSSQLPTKGNSSSSSQSLMKGNSSFSSQSPAKENSFTNVESSISEFAVSSSKFSHGASYLFDKMFEVHPKNLAQPLPEQVLVRPSQQAAEDASRLVIRPVIEPLSGGARRTGATERSLKHTPVDAEKDDLRIVEESPSTGQPVRDDQEDRVSEAGTYTIQVDELTGEEEEEQARRRIDEVFGVQDPGVGSDKFAMGKHALAGLLGFDHTHDLADESEHTLNEDSNPSPVDDNTDAILDDLDDETTNNTMNQEAQFDYQEKPNVQHVQGSNHLLTRNGHVDVPKILQVNHKRSGTGRKLPSIPPHVSPAHIESNVSSIGKRLLLGNALSPARTESDSQRERTGSGQGRQPGLSSSPGHASPAVNGHSPNTSTSSFSDLDGQLSASVTSTRHLYFSSSPNDSSSSSVFVIGTEDCLPHVLCKTPCDAQVNQQKDTCLGTNGIKTRTPHLTRNKVPISSQQTSTALKDRPPQNSTSLRSSVEKKLSIPGILNRKGSVDNGSVISETSSDTGDANSISRSSSRGKTSITKTRTNKTFELRRARAGSFDEKSTLQKSISLSSSSSSFSAVGSLIKSSHAQVKVSSNALHSVSESSQLSRKSLSIPTQDKRKATSGTPQRPDNVRKDNQAQKLQRVSSLTLSQPAPLGRKDHLFKPHMRSTPVNRHSLSLSGLTSVVGRSQSQPNSRSSSPKVAEKLAWKRRKEYDARKSVADAKANKTKSKSSPGEVTMRVKPVVTASLDSRMFHSASFTNSSALSLSLHRSAASSRQLSAGKESHHSISTAHAFIPFHSSHHNVRTIADEEGRSASAITQESSKSLASLLAAPSAFTPPLPSQKAPVSPVNASLSEASVSLRRRTLNMEVERPKAAPALNSVQDCPQTSYDTLIVTSVYQLSQKLKQATQVIMGKLSRERNRTMPTPSPVEDFLNESGRSQITAWKSANQELASTLTNLRALERHVRIIQGVLFPTVDAASDADVPDGKLQDIGRKLGFQPIQQPAGLSLTREVESPDMQELTAQLEG